MHYHASNTSSSVYMQKRGLVNTKGGRVCKNGITKILKNPFYIGIMKVKGQTFEGNHKPLITTQIFKKTQLIIKGRQNTKGLKHNYLFNEFRRINLQICGAWHISLII